MSKQQTELAGLIESVVGGEHVTAGPALQVDGLAPLLLIKPGSSEEVARCLRICADLDAAVIPAGLMTWLECGNPVKRADVVLSLERMGRVVEYSPPDLTATVEAGLTLSDFNRIAARERQWLPFNPPGSAAASLGAIAACNSSGALRLGFGTPRDYVIGLKLAHADGTESKSSRAMT
jgi:glycolate oxidase FAD binding subunit